MRTTLASLLLVCGLAATANAQLVINEVWENPPNGGDDAGYEFIEIYGPPNFDLTGYMVACVKGTGGDLEIDEAFTLDGWKTDANGFIVLHGATSNGGSPIRQFGHMTPFPRCASSLPAGTQCWDPIRQVSLTNREFVNGVPFSLCDVNIRDFAGKLENDGSSTYVLIRKRPNHALNPTPMIVPGVGGQPTDHFGYSRYLAGYSWAKDFNHDINQDSRLDFGDEAHNANMMQPLQIVDEVSWSNGDGFEYNTPSRGLMSGKISETPGFNPDAVSRVRYLGVNPLIGWTVEDGEAVRTTLADESWIYGENLNVNGNTPTYGVFKDFYETASKVRDDINRPERTFGAPTDPAGGLYTFIASSSPLETPFFEQTGSYDPINGFQLFEPYLISGFRVSPGALNDAPAGSALVGTEIATQFRFVRGDFDFNGVVDCDDLDMIETAASQGWTLDDRHTATRTNAQGQTVQFQEYTRQVQTFNSTLAMIRMDLTDGSTGEWTSSRTFNGSGNIENWGGAVTIDDLIAFNTEFAALVAVCNPLPVGACCTGTTCAAISEADCATAGGVYAGDDTACSINRCCPADFNALNGVSVQDIFDFLTAWLSGSNSADFNHVNAVTVQDIFDFLTAWLAGC